MQTSWQQEKLGRVVYLSAQGEIEIEFGEPSVSCGEEMSQKEEESFSRAERAFQPEMNCIKTVHGGAASSLSTIESQLSRQRFIKFK